MSAQYTSRASLSDAVRARSVSKLVGLLLVTALFAPAAARAAPKTWAASPNDGNWSTGFNWGGTVPVSGDTLTFGTSSITTLNNDLTTGSFNVGSITFSSGAGAYSISGNDFILGGAITNSSSSLQTISD